jgi:SAM-dependent methyltransferase
MMGDAALTDRIAERLRCPACSAGVRVSPRDILCSGCGASYEIRDGVLLLARMGTTLTWTDGPEGGATEDSGAYQECYRDVARAEEYNAAYAEQFLKRASTAREFAILRRLLGSQERSRLLLELPCGGGRLSGVIAPFADLIVEADIAQGQVLYGRRNSRLATPQIWMTASAFHIPFRDETFDGTACIRLCHHLPTPAERERLMRELLRVSKRFVIMTFFDHHSIKNWLRRMRRPLDGKPPKMTMTVHEVARIAAENGARLVACPALSTLGSGHRYALMVKQA